MTQLIPESLPNGTDVILEGRNIGEKIEIGETAFLKEKNVSSDAAYKERCAKKGEITWNAIMGLSSVDEEVEALKYLYRYGKETGVIIDRCIIIANMRMGLPAELWNKAPIGTSFMLENPDDYVRIAQAAPIQPSFEDFHIGSPASVRNTINALRAGCGYVGTLSQYSWDYPYWENDVEQVIEVVKALGIVAQKRRQNIIVDSYMDDGIPSQFMDYVSIVGYARLEKYIVDELCGANYSTGFGGLTGDVSIKIATWLALNDILKADHNVVSFLYGNTIDVSGDDFDLNYTIAAMEMVLFAIVERIYRTGISLLPIPVTENIRVPTREEIAKVHTVVRKAIHLRSQDYEKILDFSRINEMRSTLVEEGNKFYQNIKHKLNQMKVDVSDPLKMLLAVRRLGAAKLEELCHPGERNPHLARGISPFIPTALFMKSLEEKESVITMIRSEGLERAVEGMRIVTGSTDAHEFGLLVLNYVLKDLGADVIEGGYSLDAEEVLDLAATRDATHIALSTHNGLCLDYARHIMKLARERRHHVKVFMGGRLNGIIEGFTEPVDVSDRLLELGVIPCKELIDLFKIIWGYGTSRV